MKIQRGRILRDASLGPGIVASEGKNIEFDLVRCWHGDTPPKVDMVVELILTADDEIQILKPVDPAVLGKEQAEKIAQEAQLLASKGLHQSKAIGKKVVDTTGYPILVFILLIAACWTFLPFADVSFMNWPNGKDLSFVEFTRVLNADQDDFLQRYSNRESGGLWLFVPFASLVLVPAAAILKPYLLRIASVFPLALMILYVTAFYFKVSAFIDSAYDRMRGIGFGGDTMKAALEQMMEKAMDSYSLSYGFYFGLLLCIALLAVSLLKSPALSPKN